MQTRYLHRSRFWPRSASIEVALFCVFAIVVAYFLVARPTPDTVSSPIYPNAENVESRELQPGEPTPLTPNKTISFLTQDRGEEVLAFYEDTLPSAGWTLSDSSRGDEPDVLYFHAGQAGKNRTRPAVVITPAGDGKVRVELKLFYR